jgi:integrase
VTEADRRRLHEAGWALVKIADQLGHVDPSMTMDNYFERDLMEAAASRAGAPL